MKRLVNETEKQREEFSSWGTDDFDLNCMQTKCLQTRTANSGLLPDLFHDLPQLQTWSDAAERLHSLSGHESGCLFSSGPLPSSYRCQENQKMKKKRKKKHPQLQKTQKEM